jgi:threonine dehydrogenase-like Zn-dependent dehydrogenase
MIMGHEFVGKIIKPAMNGILKVNDKVVVFPKLYCGNCLQCTNGKQNLCKHAEFFGVFSKNGAMRERMVINERYLIKIDSKLNDIEISLTEPLAVAQHAIMKIIESKMSSDSNILIIGAGTIGLFVLQLLKLHGYSNIYIMDLSNTRLKIAKSFGAICLNPKTKDYRKFMNKKTDGEMFLCSIEAVGTNKTAAMSLDVLQQGGMAIWIGNAEKKINLNMQDVVTSEVKITGSFLYTLNDFIESIRIISNELLDCKSLISRVISLEETPKYFEKLSTNYEGKLLKIIIDPRK